MDKVGAVAIDHLGSTVVAVAVVTNITIVGSCCRRGSRCRNVGGRDVFLQMAQPVAKRSSIVIVNGRMYQQVGQYVLHQLDRHGQLAGILDRGRYQRHVDALDVVVARLEQRQVRQHVVQNVLLRFDRFGVRFAAVGGGLAVLLRFVSGRLAVG